MGPFWLIFNKQLHKSLFYILNLCEENGSGNKLEVKVHLCLLPTLTRTGVRKGLGVLGKGCDRLRRIELAARNQPSSDQVINPLTLEPIIQNGGFTMWCWPPKKGLFWQCFLFQVTLVQNIAMHTWWEFAGNPRLNIPANTSFTIYSDTSTFWI